MLQHKQGVYKKRRPTVVPLFTFSALLRLWTQNAILEGAGTKSLKNPTNFTSTSVRIYVKDAKPLNCVTAQTG